MLSPPERAGSGCMSRTVRRGGCARETEKARRGSPRAGGCGCMMKSRSWCMRNPDTCARHRNPYRTGGKRSPSVEESRRIGRDLMPASSSPWTESDSSGCSACQCASANPPRPAPPTTVLRLSVVWWRRDFPEGDNGGGGMGRERGALSPGGVKPSPRTPGLILVLNSTTQPQECPYPSDHRPLFQHELPIFSVFSPYTGRKL